MHINCNQKQVCRWVSANTSGSKVLHGSIHNWNISTGETTTTVPAYLSASSSTLASKSSFSISCAFLLRDMEGFNFWANCFARICSKSSCVRNCKTGEVWRDSSSMIPTNTGNSLNDCHKYVCAKRDACTDVVALKWGKPPNHGMRITSSKVTRQGVLENMHKEAHVYAIFSPILVPPHALT